MAIGAIRGRKLAVGKNDASTWLGMAWVKGLRPSREIDKDSSPLFYTRLKTMLPPLSSPETKRHHLRLRPDGGSSVAADPQGKYVYITWHAPKPGNTTMKRPWRIHCSLRDEGKSFVRKPAITKPTGGVRLAAACGVADPAADVFAFLSRRLPR